MMLSCLMIPAGNWWRNGEARETDRTHPLPSIDRAQYRAVVPEEPWNRVEVNVVPPRWMTGGCDRCDDLPLLQLPVIEETVVRIGK